MEEWTAIRMSQTHTKQNAWNLQNMLSKKEHRYQIRVYFHSYNIEK